MERTLGDDMAKKQKEQYQKNPRLLVVVAITLLLILAGLFVVTTVNRVNVAEAVKTFTTMMIPIADPEEEPIDKERDRQLEKRIAKLQDKVREKEAELQAVEKQLDRQMQETERLELEQERLVSALGSVQMDREETMKKHREVVQAIGGMSAKRAAPILVELNEQEALSILKGLKVEQVAEILGKMEPKDAAAFTSLLAEE